MVAGGPPVWQQGGRLRIGRIGRIGRINASTHWTHCTPLPSKARARGRERGRRRHTAAQSAETLNHGRGGGGTRVPPGRRCASTRSTPATSTSCLANPLLRARALRCATCVQLHRLAGRHGRRPNCNGLHVARPTGRPEGLTEGRPAALRAALMAARPARPPRGAPSKKGRPEGRSEGPPGPGRRAARVGPAGRPPGRPAALTTL